MIVYRCRDIVVDDVEPFARGTFGAVRDITWCLVRLRLLGLRPGT